MINAIVSLAFETPAHRAWSVLSKWEYHSRWVPLTRVWVAHDTGGVGTTFIGRTGLGPIFFDDPMEVTEFTPPSGSLPGRCSILKTGKLVRGTAGFTVTPLTTTTCRVEWFENIEIASTFLTRPFEPLLAFFARRAFKGVLNKVAQDIKLGFY